MFTSHKCNTSQYETKTQSHPSQNSNHQENEQQRMLASMCVHVHEELLHIADRNVN
jgi:hypothetical protein